MITKEQLEAFLLQKPAERIFCGDSDKKVKILEYLAAGKSCKQIGGFLCNSARTIEHYITEMKKETGTENIPHLVAHALRCGVIE